MVKQFVLTALSSPGVLHHLGWDWIRVSRERLILRLKLNNCYEKLSRDCGISITSKLVRINVRARMELSHQNSGVWPTNTTTCNCTAVQGAKYFPFLETHPSNFGSFLYKLSTGSLPPTSPTCVGPLTFLSPAPQWIYVCFRISFLYVKYPKFSCIFNIYIYIYIYIYIIFTHLFLLLLTSILYFPPAPSLHSPVFLNFH